MPAKQPKVEILLELPVEKDTNLLADCYSYLLRQRQARLSDQGKDPRSNNSLTTTAQQLGNEGAGQMPRTTIVPLEQSRSDDTILIAGLESVAIKVE